MNPSNPITPMSRLSHSKLIITTILYMIAIVYLFMSNNAGFHGHTGRLINNAAHIPIFFILTVLYVLCFKSLNHLTVNISYLCALSSALIFSLLTEYFQSYTTYRTTSFVDFSFNFTGIILALIIYKKYPPISTNHSLQQIICFFYQLQAASFIYFLLPTVNCQSSTDN